MHKKIKNRVHNAMAIVLVTTMITSMASGVGEVIVHAEPTQTQLVCELEEHTHTAECYEKGDLICGLEENEEHLHGEDCYTKNLVCEKEEHTHTEECYQVSENNTEPTESTEPTENTEPESNSEMLQKIGLPKTEEVSINETNFPDTNFRAYVSSSAVDLDQNGMLSLDEISQIKIIPLDYPDANEKIADLTGIEYFTELESLYIEGHLVQTLDLSANTKLVQLNCGNNQMISLNVSSCENIEELWCERNKLTNLDVSNNIVLKRLSCNMNELTELNIKNNTELYKLSCGNNKLGNLDISNNRKLEYLSCSYNNLTAIDLSENQNITTLDVMGNQLTAIDLSPLVNFGKEFNDETGVESTGYGRLYLDDNQFTNIDVSMLTGMRFLRVNNNDLTELNLLSNTKLTELECNGNHLTSLNLPNLEAGCKVKSTKNTYSITAKCDGTFDMSTLPGDFNPTLWVAKKTTGGTLNGTILTVNPDAQQVIYYYDPGKKALQYAIFTLNVTHTGHDYSGELTSDDTCHTGECNICSATSSEPHTFGKWIIVKNATCTEKGERYHICTECNRKVSEEIPVLTHNYETTATVDVPATCTTDGSKSIHCAICGAIEDGTQQVIPKLGHTYGEPVVTSACSGTVTKRTCTTCGYTDVQVDGTPSHTWNTEKTVDMEPTCLSAGSKSIHCNVCGAVLDGSTEVIPALGHDPKADYVNDASYHWHECSRCDVKLDQVSHVESAWIIDSAATSTAIGMKHTECTICGRMMRTAIIPVNKTENDGDAAKLVETKKNAPDTTLDTPLPTILEDNNIFTQEEKDKMETGSSLELKLTVNSLDETDMLSRTQDKSVLEEAGSNAKLMYVDLGLTKTITTVTKVQNGPASETVSAPEPISDTGATMMEVTITIPEEIRTAANGMQRSFYMLRAHTEPGETTPDCTRINGRYNSATGAFTFDTNKFSTYAIAYEDKMPSTPSTSSDNTPIQVIDITATAEPSILTKAGETTMVVATITPSNAMNKKVTYLSSDEKVATVDANGKVTAVGDGIVTITVTTDDGKKTATVVITVKIAADPKDDKEVVDESKLTGTELAKRNDLPLLLAKGIGQKTSIKLTWLKYSGATKYEVYWAYCGDSNFKKLSNTSQLTSTHKQLSVKKNYKYIVVAYKMIDGKKVYLAKSPFIHVAMTSSKNTNAKLVNTKYNNVYVTKGKTKTLTATLTTENSKKPMIGTDHAATLRFYSSDPSVASIGRTSGIVKGKKAGTCYIYIIAHNGVYKKLKVTVK